MSKDRYASDYTLTAGAPSNQQLPPAQATPTNNPESTPIQAEANTSQTLPSSSTPHLQTLAPPPTIHPSSSPCVLEQRQIIIMIHLLHLGAEVHKTSSGAYALRKACVYGHLHIVHLLLLHGADADAVCVPRPTMGVLDGMRRSVSAAASGLGLGGGLWGETAWGGSVWDVQVQEENSGGVTGRLQTQPWALFGVVPPQQQQLAPPLQAPAEVNTQTLQAEAPQQPNIFARRVGSLSLWTSPAKMKVSLLLQAVRANHVNLAELLVTRRPILPSPTTPLHNSITSPTPSISSTKISPAVLEEALWEALNSSYFEMARVLMEKGEAVPTPAMVRELIARASTLRLTLGIRERYTRLISLSISRLPLPAFQRIEPTLVRSSAEIGSVTLLRTCFHRGANPDEADGVALYASCYNGNIEVTRYLLREAGASTRYFNWRKKGFCLALMSMELLALGMFGMLVGVWGYGMIMGSKAIAEGRVSGELGGFIVDPFGSGADGISIWELSAMTLPSAIAVFIMYTLVPLHRIFGAFCLIVKYDWRRRRAERRALLEQHQQQAV
ncbi:hypothetical protein HDV05_002256 [Chytridiales sp. JEL 0842]|nr:hypothetical protein HDV05_002256 [Chytridiales sp. JEL 0842]